MCGICGQVALNGPGAIDASVVGTMMDTMRHRGPDDEGIYAASEVVLGHRRLSIIDLNTGHQPIANEDNTVWVVFNGEIYNFRELRTQLAGLGHVFRTNTDTEVIVHLYEQYKEGCLSRLTGMFTFALWDEREKKLLLARDRVGIKPLYYSMNGRRLVFGSEIKAVIADPSVDRSIDEAGIDRFLTFLYMPGAGTLFRDVQKLEPGHYLVAQRGRVQVRRYWDLKFDERAHGGGRAAVPALAELIETAVRDHMISDVPVGVLLSGGVDSTALLSFAAGAAGGQVQTFTVGFEGGGFADERPFAKLAARQFGSLHREMTISAKEFVDFLPKYVWHMEEPVCEPPAVALYYVSKLASGHVKVLLSGEGGDEAFAGYQNYRNLLWLERAKRSLPATGLLASACERLGRLAPFARFRKYSHFLRVPLEEYYFSRTWNPASPFHRMKTPWNHGPGSSHLPTPGDRKLIGDLFRNVRHEGVLNRMLYVDSKTWLPDDLLVKADKMTMANSVELRVPFLDHRVLEYAAGLPESAKVRGFTTKYILKAAFKDRVPHSILNRPKTGFPVPYATWLNGELRPWARDTLLERRTVERGYFRREDIEGLLDRPAECAVEIFALLTLELWHRQFADSQRNSAVACGGTAHV